MYHACKLGSNQCLMSRIRIRIWSGFSQVSRSVSWSGFWTGSESRRATMTNKNRIKLRNFMFQVLNVLFWGLKASSVPGSFNVLYGGLGKGKLKFLVIKTLDQNCLIGNRIKWIQIQNTASNPHFDPVLVSTFDQKNRCHNVTFPRMNF